MRRASAVRDSGHSGANHAFDRQALLSRLRSDGTSATGSRVLPLDGTHWVAAGKVHSAGGLFPACHEVVKTGA